MVRNRQGIGTMFDNDFGGNHLDRLRKTAPQIGVFLDYANRWCSACGHKKPTKGGTKPGKGWMCADCKTKSAGTTNVKVSGPAKAG